MPTAGSYTDLTDKSMNFKNLLRAGAQYGHATRFWHPAMSPFIIATRTMPVTNKYGHSKTKTAHVFDLDITLKKWKLAKEAIINCTSNGGSVLFIGTKKQAKEIIQQEAENSFSPYICHKWPAGLFTNQKTIRKSIDYLDELEYFISRVESGEIHLSKKELIKKKKLRESLILKFGGVRKMKTLPDMVFIIDTARNAQAIAEAKLVGIPVIAICDTNSNPKDIDYIIPCNDDAKKTLDLITSNVAMAVSEGYESYQTSQSWFDFDPEILKG